MSEHAPGPWHYGGFTNIYAYHQGPHGFLHSRVVSLVPAAELEGGEDERRANARLIAAAPETAAERDRLREVNAELLAALKTLREGLTIACGQEAPYIKWLLSEADPAIAKATLGAQ
jgi:hypothetical protein